MKFITRLLKDESGTTAVEYGLIAALISVAIVTVIGLVGDNLVAVFTRIQNELAIS